MSGASEPPPVAPTAGELAASAATATSASAAAAAAAATTVYENPSEDPALYPEFDDFMTALQDKGQVNTKKGKSQGDLKFPKLMKALAPTVKTLREKYKDCGMPKNPTDAKRQLVSQVIRIRKHKDVAVLPEEFRKYAKDGKVYVINAEIPKAGLKRRF